MEGRDTPKQVVSLEPLMGYPTWGECPSCGNHLFHYGKYIELHYCHWCGQRLTWGSDGETTDR